MFKLMVIRWTAQKTILRSFGAFYIAEIMKCDKLSTFYDLTISFSISFIG